MDQASMEALLSRIARLEEEQARLKAEVAVHRGALVWTMGVHQLTPEDRNPHHAVLDPLGLDLSFEPTRAADATADSAQAAQKARDFLADANAVFLARQKPNPG